MRERGIVHEGGRRSRIVRGVKVPREAREVYNESRIVLRVIRAKSNSTRQRTRTMRIRIVQGVIVLVRERGSRIVQGVIVHVRVTRGIVLVREE